MVSSNTGARLLHTQRSANKPVPCDADTVRLMKMLMLDDHDNLAYVFFVTWLERHCQHERHFACERLAKRYALQLHCRLELDAYLSEVAVKSASPTAPPEDEIANVSPLEDAA